MSLYMSNKACAVPGHGNHQIEVTQDERSMLEMREEGFPTPMIQDILPNHSPEDREMVITGLCSDAWDLTLGSDEF